MAKMLGLMFALASLLTAEAGATDSLPHSRPAAARFVQAAMLCTKVDEEVWSLYKTCTYDCAGSRTSITIPKQDWCPLILKR